MKNRSGYLENMSQKIKKEEGDCKIDVGEKERMRNKGSLYAAFFVINSFT